MVKMENEEVSKQANVSDAIVLLNFVPNPNHKKRNVRIPNPEQHPRPPPKKQ
jgi:hypothetical protein